MVDTQPIFDGCDGMGICIQPSITLRAAAVAVWPFSSTATASKEISGPLLIESRPFTAVTVTDAVVALAIGEGTGVDTGVGELLTDMEVEVGEDSAAIWVAGEVSLALVIAF